MQYSKNLVKNKIIGFTHLILKTKVGKIFGEAIINDLMNREKTVIYKNEKFNFSVPNRLNNFRVDTFSTKEPETLEWIDTMPNESTFWDIGANIGLYSIYAAKVKNCSVFSFEPSVFNLELLARNIYLNQLQNKITIIPFALSDKMSFNSMHLTTTEWGGALSTFGEDIGWDGAPIDEKFNFSTIGCSVDEAVSNFKIPQPNFIKIDVDGIEHFILKGSKKVLKNITSLLIEVNDNYEEQSKKCSEYLMNAGMVLSKKLHSNMLENSKAGFNNTYNQIWVRGNK